MDITPVPRSSGSIDAGKIDVDDDAFEVFKRGEGAVDFRTVSWIHASVIFLKSEFTESHMYSIEPLTKTTKPSSQPGS